MEIERKFIVTDPPKDLDSYPHSEIEQDICAWNR